MTRRCLGTVMATMAVLVSILAISCAGTEPTATPRPDDVYREKTRQQMLDYLERARIAAEMGQPPPPYYSDEQVPYYSKEQIRAILYDKLTMIVADRGHPDWMMAQLTLQRRQNWEVSEITPFEDFVVSIDTPEPSYSWIRWRVNPQTKTILPNN